MKKKRVGEGKDENRLSVPEPQDGTAGSLIQRLLFDAPGESRFLGAIKELFQELIGRVKRLEDLLLSCLNGLTGGVPFKEREFFTAKEFAQCVGLKPETVRDHLNEGRIEGRRTASGRGGKPEWRIHRDEVTRYKDLGPREPKYRYRHFK